MIQRPLVVNEVLTNNHDSACYVDPVDGTVCSVGHRARKDALRYIADLEAAIDDANLVEQELVDTLALENGMKYVMVKGSLKLYATGHGPEEESDGQTEDTGRPEGGEVAAVDLAGVSPTVGTDLAKQSPQGR